MDLAKMNFSDLQNWNPCIGCPAPCCRIQLTPFNSPATFMDIDFVYYMVFFPRTEFVVSEKGDWRIVKWEDCQAFDATKMICKLHNKPQKPRTCTMYNPHNCWYKSSFVLDGAATAYRLDLNRFEVWVKEIQFAEDGRITAAPDFERSLEILKGIPIEPVFKPMTNEFISGDARRNDIPSSAEFENRKNKVK